MNNQDTRVQLLLLINMLVRYSWLIGLAIAVGLGTAWLITSSKIPEFESSTTILVQNVASAVEIDPNALQVSRQQAQTFGRLINTRPILEEAAQLLESRGQGSLSRSSVSANTIPGTQLITIEVIDPNRQQAAWSANSIAETFINRTLQNSLASIAQMEQLARAQGIEDTSALTANRLAALQTLEVVEIAVPAGRPLPQSDNALIATGGVLGLFIGLFMVFILSYLSDKLPPPDRLEKETGLPLLGILHKWRTEELPVRNRAIVEPPPHIAEQFRTLASSVVFSSSPSSSRVIQITSSIADEGKTSVAIGLGVGLAERGHNVAIVDADLRRPALSKQFYENGADRDIPGLSTVLAGQSRFSDSTSDEIEDLDLSANRLRRNLTIIPSGPVPPNASSLMSGTRLTQLLSRLRNEHDFVIVDSPPLAGLADSTLIAERSEAVIIVASYGVVRYGQLQSSLKIVERSSAENLGIIITQVERGKFGYNYYGGAYGGAYADNFYTLEPSSNGRYRRVLSPAEAIRRIAGRLSRRR